MGYTTGLWYLSIAALETNTVSAKNDHYEEITPEDSLFLYSS
jgi:hypothetical protein